MEQAKQTAASLVTQYGGTYSADPLASLLHMVRAAAMAERGYAELVERSEDLLLEVNYGKAGGTRAEPHPYVKLWNEERDRLVKFSKVALDAGVQRREVELAEADGRRLIEVIENAIEFQRVRTSIASQVRAWPR